MLARTQTLPNAMSFPFLKLDTLIQTHSSRLNGIDTVRKDRQVECFQKLSTRFPPNSDETVYQSRSARAVRCVSISSKDKSENFGFLLDTMATSISSGLKSADKTCWRAAIAV
jgi:hypothetical protein